MSFQNSSWPEPKAIMTFEEGDPEENPWVAGKPPTEEIEIAAYSSEWPKLFETVREAISKALPGIVLEIQHIGSTAVPLLFAKAVIDVDLIVRDPDKEEEYIPVLATLGYELTVRERSWYQHRMLRHASPRVNLHIFGPMCPEHIRHVMFREWLRDHPEDRVYYSKIKEEAKRDVNDVQCYNRNKQAAVRDIYRKIFEHQEWA